MNRLAARPGANGEPSKSPVLVLHPDAFRSEHLAPRRPRGGGHRSRTPRKAEPANSLVSVVEFCILSYPILQSTRVSQFRARVNAHWRYQTGTLDLLIALSEDLPKHEQFFTSTVAKTVDTLRNLLNNDPAKLAQHILVNERTVDAYLLHDWRWNSGRYGIQRGLREIVDTLNKVRPPLSEDDEPPTCRQEMTLLDNALKAKLNNYNLVKGSLVQMQRKKT